MARYKNFSTNPIGDYTRRQAKKRAKNSIFKTTKRRKKSGCYIATCVYGSYDCPSVWVLRRYRDQVLESTCLGRFFISLYYAISPVVVRFFGDSRIFRSIVKQPLDKMVNSLKEQGFDNTPYQD